MFLSNIINKLYRSLVTQPDPDIQAHYEGYKESDPEYHKKHHIQSLKFLWALRKYYKNGKNGKLPEAPHPYTPKVFGAPVVASPTMPTSPAQKKTGAKKTPPAAPKAAPPAAPKAAPPAAPKAAPPADPKVKLPYLEGSESGLYNRKEAHYIAKDCMPFDVVSFDIFDTLILRPFSNPVDLFYIVGEKLGIDNFRKIRINAEREAREYAVLTKGNKEVTIYDIYEYVNRYTGVDVKQGAELEIEIEVDLCFANPKMKQLFNILKCQNKRIVLTSDMYLGSNVLKRMLDKVGITGYERIFVSCEQQTSKRSGGLYQLLLDYLGDGVKVVHIGDNHETDFLKAKEYGITSYFYKNVNKAGGQYRADGMSPMISSAYAGIVNSQLHTGAGRRFTPYYEYGFIYGGLYILGFCNWIQQFAVKENIDKVIFLSRDGHIYKKIYDDFFGEVKSEYLYWSRVATLKYASDAQYGKDYFMTRVINDRINEDLQSRPIKLTQLFKILQLEELLECLPDYSLSQDLLLTKENEKMVKTFFHKKWEDVISIYRAKEEGIKKIISQKIKGCKKVAFVDVGWNGSGPLGLKYLIEEKWKLDCHVDCLIAASKTADDVANITRLQDKDLYPYMFSIMMNRDHYRVHKDTNKGMNSLCFEMFTQACEPSFSAVDNELNFTFEPAEVENYKIIQEIHKGIYDFCERYSNAFSKYPMFMNISGYDAYCPFRMIIRNPKFLKKILSNVVYARNVGNSNENFGFFKVGEIFNKLGL